MGCTKSLLRQPIFMMKIFLLFFALSLIQPKVNLKKRSLSPPKQSPGHLQNTFIWRKWKKGTDQKIKTKMTSTRGRVASFLGAWIQANAFKNVLKIIEGYSIPFFKKSPPPLTSLAQKIMAKDVLY